VGGCAPSDVSPPHPYPPPPVGGGQGGGKAHGGRPIYSSFHWNINPLGSVKGFCFAIFASLRETNLAQRRQERKDKDYVTWTVPQNVDVSWSGSAGASPSRIVLLQWNKWVWDRARGFLALMKKVRGAWRRAVRGSCTPACPDPALRATVGLPGARETFGQVSFSQITREEVVGQHHGDIQK
jgi:hypothetical protein